MNKTEKTYQFQMSTVAYIGGEPVEGDLSQITDQTIVFIPKPGMQLKSNQRTKNINCLIIIIIILSINLLILYITYTPMHII